MSRVILRRHELVPRGRLDHQPPPLSWDYLDSYGSFKNLALVTCPNGHVTRMAASVHRVDPDGTVHPSYVCTVGHCNFHAFVRLEGWGSGR